MSNKNDVKQFKWPMIGCIHFTISQLKYKLAYHWSFVLNDVIFFILEAVSRYAWGVNGDNDLQSKYNPFTINIHATMPENNYRICGGGGGLTCPNIRQVCKVWFLS